ncbi:sugar 3,4-ketoisomerase [Flavobacterium sp. W21_SRS_FM6]|uniref:sugar 3,4-ketoisomerase n=1 Tax=Flavobacterium sp. W21_SRS_FM6 TaxID=3240268 RepID=UPI003F91A4F3
MINNGWNITAIDHIQDDRGALSVAELGKHFDFKVERIFYLTNIGKDEQRGEHAHEQLNQFILCVAGSFDIILDNGKVKETYSISNNGKGLFVDGLVWRTMSNFTSDAVMLVLCDRIYQDDKVIRDYDEFLVKVKVKENNNEKQ